MDAPAAPPRTLFEKIWTAHQVVARPDGHCLLYVDRHLIHDGSRPAFELLRRRGLHVRRPDRTTGTADHYLPTGDGPIADPEKRAMVESLAANAAEAGIDAFGPGDPRQGIVHVIGPEQGLSLPGALIVCGDSHTSTHGALGALAFGIGMTEVSHVLATQTIWQQRPRTMRIGVEGALGAGVTAKDVILAIIAAIGTAGAVGHVVEYAGTAIRGLSMEGRLTLCNMSIEAGARAGMVAPDDATYEFLHGRPHAPSGPAWDTGLVAWLRLPTDDGAPFDREVTLDAAAIAPMVTWGTSPEDASPITARVPDPAAVADPERREALIRALDYMGLRPGTALDQVPVDRVFIGSCTNGRISDLRAAAAVASGRHVAAGVEAWVVPGSTPVRLQAEAEGLDRVFTQAGFQWRGAGCSMCLGTNGEIGQPGQRVASTSNRNFVGRQGRGVRTHLMSPAMAAAAAVTGRLSDVRRLMEG